VLVAELIPSLCVLQINDGGRLVIAAEPADGRVSALWGMTPIQHIIHLPAVIDHKRTQALMSLNGQLLVRLVLVA